MATPATNIRVFVQWTEQTVFAGEDVECQITFKNVASNPPPPRTLLHPPSMNGFPAGGERQRKSPIAQVRNSNTLNSRPPPPVRGHRSALSLTAPVGMGRSPPGPGSWTGHSKASASGSTHKRSVSIISIGASESAVDDTASNGTAGTVDGQRMMRQHRRSASLQITPRRNGQNGPTSGLSSPVAYFCGIMLIFYSANPPAIFNTALASPHLELSRHRGGSAREACAPWCFNCAKYTRYERGPIRKERHISPIPTNI